MMWRALVDFAEGFLTVFAAAFSAAVLNQSSYITPNKWAVIAGAVGGLLAGIRKVQARLAPPPTAGAR